MRFCRLAVLGWGMAVGLACGSWAAQDPATQLGFPPSVAAAMRGIDSERIRAHVRFLADDLLEGRGTGARGGDIAARYIAAQFALDGLKPAGDNGTYLQEVHFAGVQTLPGTSASLSSRHATFWRASKRTSSVACANSSHTMCSACCRGRMPALPLRPWCIRRITITSASIRR